MLLFFFFSQTPMCFLALLSVLDSVFSLLNNSIKISSHLGQQFKIIFITADYFLDCVIECFFFKMPRMTRRTVGTYLKFHTHKKSREEKREE